MVDTATDFYHNFNLSLRRQRKWYKLYRKTIIYKKKNGCYCRIYCAIYVTEDTPSYCEIYVTEIRHLIPYPSFYLNYAYVFQFATT